MDSPQTPTENADQKNEAKDATEEIEMAKLEAMVTPEQVLSASVARKRRTITRKRTSSISKARSQTPMRTSTAIDGSSSEDEPNDLRPKTPERRRKKITRTVSNNVKLSSDENGSNGSNRDCDETNGKPQESDDKSKNGSGNAQAQECLNTEKESNNKNISQENGVSKASTENGNAASNIKETKPEIKTEEKLPREAPKVKSKKNPEDAVIERRSRAKRQNDSASNSEVQSVVSEPARNIDRGSSIPRQIEEQIEKLDNFVSTNKKELLNLFNKAKLTMEEKGKELTRRKFRKTDQKRSQSTPRQLTEADLLESFRKAQAATAEREYHRIRSKSARGYSSGSDKSVSPEPKRPARKSGRTPVQEIVKPKKVHKQLKDKVKSNKIIEILDPKTSKVIAVKDVGYVARLGVLDFFRILRYYSIGELFREYRKYRNDMAEERKNIRRLRRVCINHLVILLIFCGLGGIIFKFTEGSFENFYKCGVKRVKRDFIDLLWVKSHNLREEEWKSLARTRLRTFEDELHTAHEAGIHSYSGQRSWSFLNGIVYCLTVVTTIGYGHLYPTTKTGQALTIVYALIGIPLFLIILTDFGKLFTRCIKFLWSFVRRLYYTGSCRSVRKTAQVQEIFKGAQMMYDIARFRRPSKFDPNMNDAGHSPGGSQDANTAPPTPAISNFEINDEFNLPISIAILLLVLYILLGAIIFGIWEGWDFFASFYFVFISMSTIGFGDYVPRHPVFMIVSIVYLVFGLALMSMCINVVQVKISDTFNQASAKIGATIGLGVTEDDSSIKPVPPKTIEMPQVHASITDISIPTNDSPIKPVAV